MEITREQLIGWAKEIDAQLPVPEHPEDFSTPVDFGSFGCVVMSDNVPMLISVGDDPWEMLESKDVRVFAQGFGCLFMVTYGLTRKRIDDSDEDFHVTRCVFGMTHEGVNTAIMRFLDTDEVIVDEEGDGEGAGVDAMKAVWE